jgi:hypothetical protein
LLSLAPLLIVPAVRGRLARSIVVIALILSVGGHWGLLQVTAWIGMAADYCQTEDLSTALIKTFDGKNPCGLCKFVSEGKETEKQSDSKVDSKKLDSFAFQNTEFRFPTPFHNTFTFDLVLNSRIEAPPTPPPLLS